MDTRIDLRLYQENQSICSVDYIIVALKHNTLYKVVLCNTRNCRFPESPRISVKKNMCLLYYCMVLCSKALNLEWLELLLENI